MKKKINPAAQKLWMVELYGDTMPIEIDTPNRIGEPGAYFSRNDARHRIREGYLHSAKAVEYVPKEAAKAILDAGPWSVTSSGRVCRYCDKPKEPLEHKQHYSDCP